MGAGSKGRRPSETRLVKDLIVLKRLLSLSALSLFLLAGCGMPAATLQASPDATLSTAGRDAILNLRHRVIAGKANPITQIKVMHVVEMNLPTGKKGKRFALNYLVWGKENGKPIGYDRSVTMDCELISDPAVRRSFETGHRPVFLSTDTTNILKDDVAMMLLARELATAITYAEFEQEKDLLTFVAQTVYDEAQYKK